ncbi:hypothetical protein KSW81_008112 [Nannochloris sp. 'desiccata']|nr:hypothetical protein KSW81_008112 [Chlorella desiccata (nom. nud.)]
MHLNIQSKPNLIAAPLPFPRLSAALHSIKIFAAAPSAHATPKGPLNRRKRATQQRLQELRLYVQQHGNADVPYDYPGGLGQWTTSQRHRWRRGLLPIETFRALSSLDFAYDSYDARWKARFQQLAAFHSRHGHCRVPFNDPEIPPGLYAWLLVQRQRRRQGRLEDARKRRLDGLGFDWEPKKGVSSVIQTMSVQAAFPGVVENVTALQGFEETTVLSSNNAWMLQSGYMVFFMQVGFAMLCAGSVRAKNAKNIILLNILDACLGSICWWATGYAFAYGDPDDPTNVNKFIGNRNFFLRDLNNDALAFWFFQFTFAATAATIVSGAVAERCKFQAYLMYEMMLVLFVYPTMAHWVWSGNGWATAFTDKANLLFGTGVYDFAGDGPVHMIGGFASLAAAYILGPRIGRFDANGKAVDMPGHNASLTLLGVFFLWFGWYGFNPGSTLAIYDASNLAALVAINTTLGAATGALSCLAVNCITTYASTGVVVYDLLMVGNGALGGLVSVTGGCGFYRPWAAFITGIIGGAVYFGSSKLILHVMKVDDPLDAIAVHAFCGMWGMIATAAFADPNVVTQAAGFLEDEDGSEIQRNYGFILGGGGSLLAAHLVYILAIVGWSMGLMTPFFFILKKLGQFRVAPEVEAAGLDVSHHGGSAYPHDPETARAKGSDVTLTPEMIDRKIEEALARAKMPLV